jgi:hypothetical protein
VFIFFTLQVGGSSEVEVSEKKDRVTDALNATRAAVCLFVQMYHISFPDRLRKELFPVVALLCFTHQRFSMG